MKRSNSDDLEITPQQVKKRRFSNEMLKVLTFFEPIEEVIEISDDDERELSPADSGFKEPSTSPCSSLKNVKCKTSRKTPSETAIQIRGSDRIKKIQDEEEKLTETEKMLRHTLNYQNLVHPLETTIAAMCRFNPKVQCRMLSKYEITKRMQLGRIIPNVQEFPNEIEFQGMILHQWKNYDGDGLHYFVRWIPVNILDDEWVIADYAKAINLKKKVKLSELNTRQRRIICERIFSGKKI